jgi:hypothetical protein
MQELNQELLVVTNLSGGKWRLEIDGRRCGDYSSQNFSSGINLAAITNTPQYQQAVAIMLTNDNRLRLAAAERGIVAFEYGYAAKGFDPVADAAKVREDVQNLMNAQMAKDAQERKIPGQWKTYLDTAARQDGIAKEQELAAAMSAAAKPRPHTYLLTLVGGEE